MIIGTSFKLKQSTKSFYRLDMAYVKEYRALQFLGLVPAWTNALVTFIKASMFRRNPVLEIATPISTQTIRRDCSFEYSIHQIYCKCSSIVHASTFCTLPVTSNFRNKADIRFQVCIEEKALKTFQLIRLI